MPDAAVSVAANVRHRNIELRAEFPAGRVTAVVGPNGAGKSTLLQVIAGQVRVDDGQVTLNEHVVSSATRHVPTHRRNVAMLAQRALLFPHLSVIDNVAFGLRARGASRREARRLAEVELDAVDCLDLSERFPRELSGGQAQRVAIARSLAVDPEVILLDEPMASLDVGVASNLRTLLAERLRGRTALLVTHDALDLWTLADDIALIEEGRVVAHGDVDEVMGRPPTAFLAGLGGLNRLLGEAVSFDEMTLTGGDAVVIGSAEAAAPPEPGASAMALFEPSAVGLHRLPPEGSPRNVWPVTVDTLEPRGALVRIRLRLGTDHRLAADVTPRTVAALGLAAGEQLWASVKAAQVRIERRVPSSRQSGMMGQ